MPASVRATRSHVRRALPTTMDAARVSALEPFRRQLTTDLRPSRAMSVLANMIEGRNHHELSRALGLDVHERAHAMRLCSAIDRMRFESKKEPILLELSCAADVSFHLQFRFVPIVSSTSPSALNDCVHGEPTKTPTPKRRREDEGSSTTGESSGGSTNSSKDAVA